MAWEVLWEEAWSPAPPCNYLYTTTLGKLCQNRSPLCRVLYRERLVLPYIYLLQGRKGILMYGQYTESKTIPEVTLLSPTSSLPQLPSGVFHCLISCRKGRKQPCSRWKPRSSNRTSRRWKAAFKPEPQSSRTSLTTKQCLAASSVWHFLPVILEVHTHIPSERE